MSDLWKNTCVLISSTGNIILSSPLLKGHNQAISYCANQVNLDIIPEQSMISMLESVTNGNHVVLLNCGMTKDENGVDKRTGYLALPSSFLDEQVEQIENLKLLLEEYHSVTVWKNENNRLKTKSMGDSNMAMLLIQEMIDENTLKNAGNQVK